MVARSTTLQRNIIALWSAFAIRILLAFIFVPVITGSLGASRYGIWGILFQVINYLALLDFGFEKAVVNFVASAIGRGDTKGASGVIRTSTRLYFWFGLAAAILATIFAFVLLPYLKIETRAMLTEAQIALVIIGLFSGIRFWFTPITAALGGFQKYDSLTIIQVSEDVARTIAMIVLLKFGFGLVALASCILVFGVARQLVSAWWLARVFPDWDRKAEPETDLRSRLYSYSRITFGITLVWMIVFNTDSMLLGFFASTAAAGIYAPATQLAGYMRHLVNAVGTPLTASAAHAQGASQLSQVKDQYLRLFSYASYGSFALLAIVTSFSAPLVKLWLPTGFDDTARVMIILAVGSAVFIPHILSNAMLFAVNRHRYILYTVIAEAASKLLLAALLIGRLGPVGIALANSIPQVILYSAVFPFLVGKALDQSPVDLLWRQFKSGIVALLCTWVPALLLTKIVSLDNWFQLIATTSMVCVTGVLGFLLVLTAPDRKKILDLLLRKNI